MNTALDQPIRKFNPGTFQSDDEVVRQFVVRQRELGLVLEVLRGNIDSPSCQHALIVGPRGRGKTMLLARVEAELRTDAALSERLFPVRFMEESQEITTIADFWLEALFHLAHAIASGNPELSRELFSTHADLTARWRDTNMEECARAAVLEAAAGMGRKLVLMVENLQALCNEVDEDFGWQLRKTLQSEPQVMLLATATSRFKGLDEAAQPFFELFRIVALEPLDTDECRRLWTMASGDAQTHREIKPLRILTGGNPRLLIIVATFARHRSLRQLLEDLVALIDDHTEYFRGHLTNFAPTERRVYLAVIDLWRPSGAQEIAARARKDIRTVSALIARLVDRGAILVEGTGRKRRYVAAERLYSIYYKLRRERDEADLVRNLVQFMTVFYSGEELANMAGTWRMEAEQSPAIREGLQRALSASDSQELQVQVAKALLFEGITHDLSNESEAALAAYDDLIARFGDSDSPELQVQVAEALLFKGVTYSQRDESEAALAAYDDLIARFGDSDSPKIQVQVAQALLFKGITYGQRDKTEAELAAYDDLVARFGDNDSPELQVQVAEALLFKGVTHGQRDESEAELAAYDDLVARFGDNDSPELQAQVAKALVNKGVTHGQRDESEAELAAYDDLVARFGDSDSRNSRRRSPRRWSAKVSRTANVTNPRQSSQPTTIWSRVSVTVIPRNSRRRSPKRWSTRGSRTANATSRTQSSQPTTIWSRVSVTVIPRNSRRRSPKRWSTRGSRTANATSQRQSSQPTTIWSRVSVTVIPRNSRCRLPRRWSTRVSRTANAMSQRQSSQPTTIWSRVSVTVIPGTPGAGCQGAGQQGCHARRTR